MRGEERATGFGRDIEVRFDVGVWSARGKIKVAGTDRYAGY